MALRWWPVASRRASRSAAVGRKFSRTSVADLTKLSRSLGLKLSGCTTTLVDKKVTVEFGLEPELEWVNERPKAKIAISDAIKTYFGADISVEFTVRKREAGPEESSAVELPAEGSKLEQLARQVFGAEPNP